MLATISFSQPWWVLMLSHSRLASSWYSVWPEIFSLPPASVTSGFCSPIWLASLKRSLYLSMRVMTSSFSVFWRVRANGSEFRDQRDRCDGVGALESRHRQIDVADGVGHFERKDRRHLGRQRDG